MIPVVILAVALSGAAAHLTLTRGWNAPWRVCEVFVLYMLVVGFGVASGIGFVGHVFFADAIATDIGWPTGSPFQFEVGMANLGIAVCGLLCAKLRGGFWTATAIGASVFYFGDGIGHIQELRAGNHATYNSGPTLYLDLLVPVITIGLLLGYHRLARRADERAASRVSMRGRLSA